MLVFTPLKHAMLNWWCPYTEKLKACLDYPLIGSPDLGSVAGGQSDLFWFVPFSPLSCDLFRFAPIVFGTAPLCSDWLRFLPIFKNPLMGLFLMGCFPGDFQGGNGPLRHSGKRPIEGGKRPIKGKWPIKANGLFSGTRVMVENGPSKKAHQEVYKSFSEQIRPNQGKPFLPTPLQKVPDLRRVRAPWSVLLVACWEDWSYATSSAMRAMIGQSMPALKRQVLTVQNLRFCRKSRGFRQVCGFCDFR